MQNQKNFTLRILPEILFSIPLAMYFPKNHYSASIINSKVKIIHSAGLIDYWKSNYLLNRPKEISLPKLKKLTLEQLAGGNYILFGGCFISFLVFLYENLRNLRNWVNIFWNKWMCLNVFLIRIMKTFSSFKPQDQWITRKQDFDSNSFFHGISLFYCWRLKRILGKMHLSQISTRKSIWHRPTRLFIKLTDWLFYKNGVKI